MTTVTVQGILRQLTRNRCKFAYVKVMKSCETKGSFQTLRVTGCTKPSTHGQPRPSYKYIDQRKGTDHEQFGQREMRINYFLSSGPGPDQKLM